MGIFKQKGDKGPKITKIEKDIRITYCYKLLLQGYTTSEIYSFFNKKYDLSTSQTDRYIKRAKEIIYNENKLTREQMKEEQRKRYLELYNESRKLKQLGVSKGALDSLGKLDGLDEPIEHNINGDLFKDVTIKVIRNADRHD